MSHTNRFKVILLYLDVAQIMNSPMRPRKISKVKKIAIKRNISAHELAKNILSEAGYHIERMEDRTEQGWRGYTITFPCQINGNNFIKRMRRSWLIELADLVVEGVPAKEVATANPIPFTWTNDIK